MIEEILDVKKKTAQSLYDCVEDPLIRDKIQDMMAPNRLKLLKRASSRGGSFHRRTVGPVPKSDQTHLLKNHFFDSSDVVAITGEISTQLKSLAIDKQQTFELYQENETVKEKMMEEDKAKLAALKQETSKLQDVKREMEFEVIMLEEAAKTEQMRAKQRVADVEHRIETVKLKQEKIQDQSKSEIITTNLKCLTYNIVHLVKEIYKERGIKDCDHDLVMKAFEKENEKVQRQFNITKIIYDTYVKEIDRFHRNEAEKKRK